MGEYTDGFTMYMEHVASVVAGTANPHHRAILENYQQHAALEFCGLADAIFTPELTVDEPVYRVTIGGSAVTYSGADAVKGYYAGINKNVIMLRDEKLFVSDWGIASYSTLVRFVPGETLIAEGKEVANPAAMYAARIPLGMFWEYSADAKLVGENVYQLEEADIVELDPSDVMTLEERRAVGRRFLRRAAGPEPASA